MDYTLGIDIGTYETKGVIADSNGRVVASSSRPHKLITPKPGWAEHRPQADWWGDFVFVANTLIRESKISPNDIKAVATSAIGPCMLPVDKECHPLINGILYGVDTRAALQIEELNQKIGKDNIFELCGNALTSQSVGPKILWFKQTYPDLWSLTSQILTSTSYIVYKLTGEYVIDHFTAVNFAPWYDINLLNWTDKLSPELPMELLPKLAWSTDFVGTITSKAAEETGLSVGTPVTCGTIDAAAEAVSIGVKDNGDMMMMYGSTIFIIELDQHQKSDPRLWYAPWLFTNQFAIMAGVSTAGTLTHWFKDNFAQDLSSDNIFQQLTAEASSSPTGANGLLFIPYFSGGLTPIHNPDARGIYFGLNLTHTRGDLFRALLEGISAGTRRILDTYREVDAFPKKVFAVGGGTKNKIWLQSNSDMSNIEQHICKHSLGASYGNAFLAALALGNVKKEDIFDWNPFEKTIHPNPQKVYDETYPHFVKLYEVTKDIASEISAIQRKSI